MAKGIQLIFDKDNIIVNEIKPTRTKNLVIFLNNGELVLWEPNEIKPTKTDMKKYVNDVAQLLCPIIGPTTVLAHGVLKYDWIGGNSFDVNVGDVVIGKIEYTDDNYDKINSLEYRPRFSDLNNIINFM